jgi:hypothetical protein
MGTYRKIEATRNKIEVSVLAILSVEFGKFAQRAELDHISLRARLFFLS